MTNCRTVLIIMAINLFLITGVLAQSDAPPVLTSQEISTVVDSIGNKLKARYVFPEVGIKMADKLVENLENGNYKSIDDPQEFAYQLTEDLRGVSQDKHIRVGFEPQRIKAQNEAVTAADSLELQQNHIDRLKRGNFGFNELKILDGNVGYLDLRSFSEVEYAGETAVAAMNFLSNADAIIIDLRFNGGGSPAMIQLISSYLFASGSVHLNNFYWRPSDRHTQTWTLPHVEGKRSPNTPVYVLTSSSTFSAAEEFSYNLKNLKRATLVGETTGGGAHPGGTVNATDKFSVWIPSGRAINPITNTNWEGTGVSPDVETKSAEAKDIAHVLALETLVELNKNTENNRFYSWPLTALKVKDKPVEINPDILKSYIGTYGPRVISFEDNSLFYQRGSGTKYKLIPLNQHEFMLNDLSYFRIKFVTDKIKVIALEGHYNDGRSDRNVKTNDK